MNAEELLEQLMQTGKDLAQQGRELAAKGMEQAKDGIDYVKANVEIPEPGPERDELLKNLGAGAAAGGILALLVGTKSGRKVLSPVIKIGSVAALGTLGYKAFQRYQEQNGLTSEGKPIMQLEGPAAQQRSVAILQAMIGAAKADGNIDADEQGAIMKHVESCKLEAEAAKMFMGELQKPANADEIAALSDSPEMGVELYLASLAVTGVGGEQDEKYLSDLASKLKLPADLVKEVREEAMAPA